jgi:uncharacterized protein YciI
MADPIPHHILFYDYVENMAERRTPYREAHLAKISEEREAGRVTLAGALGTPPYGAAIVFKGVGPDEISAFADSDPYVTAGLVTSRRIERWNIV